MENSPIPLRKWFIAMYLIQSHKKGISSIQLSKFISVTQRTAWFMLHRIRYGMKDMLELQVGGENEIVEVDETFVGGKNKNRRWDKKVKQSQGRSFKDKTPVFGILQRQEYDTIKRQHKVIPTKTVIEKIITRPAKLIAIVIPNTKGKTLKPLLYERVKEGTIVVSDEWKAYNGISRVFNHQVVDHKRSQYVNESGFTTNTLEGAWSILKRAIIGTYHKADRIHLQRYADEFSYRYNTRHLSDVERFNSSNINCRLTYKQLIRWKAA